MTSQDVNSYRLRFYTSPVGVSEMATKLRESGLDVVCEGTEHVYVDAQALASLPQVYVVDNAISAIKAKHGTDFGWGAYLFRPSVMSARLVDHVKDLAPEFR